MRQRRPTHEAVSEYMRHRRKTYFFGDNGPAVPRGVAVRWRFSPDEPHGWHANMIGGLEGPAVLVGEALDIATEWFSRRGADTWVDADEWSVVFQQPALLERRGFVLHDDWDVVACWKREIVQTNPAVILKDVRNYQDFEAVARIAEQAEHPQGLVERNAVERRMERYWREYRDWNSQFVLAYHTGRAVGTARLTDEEVPVLVGVATVQDARGYGVATKVTDVLTANALNARGVCALYVDRDSQAARIYRRAGYQPLFRTRAWVHRVP